MIKPRVLFLCSDNSCRTQMAEAFLREMAGDRFEVLSAGAEATALDPDAVAAMDELGRGKDAGENVTDVSMSRPFAKL